MLSSKTWGEEGGVDDEGRAVFERVDLMGEFFGDVHWVFLSCS